MSLYRAFICFFYLNNTLFKSPLFALGGANPAVSHRVISNELIEL